MIKQALVFGLLFVANGLARALPLPDDSLVDDGSKRLQAGDTAGALTAFAAAGKKAPRDPRPHYLSAVALQKRGDAAAAEREYKAALAIDPKLAEVRNELGALYNEQHRPVEALAQFKRAVADKPDLGEAWFNLGQASLARRDCATAIDAFSHATRLAPNDADGFINLSVAARRCGKLAPATAAARDAVKRDARSAPAHLNLGLALEAAGKLDEAASEYTLATRLKPDYATAWWSLGLLERKRHRLDAAIAALTHAEQLSPTAARLADLGVAWRDKGDLAKATALFRQALAKDPRYVPARWHLAQTLAAAHQCAEMRRELARLPPTESHAAAAQKLRSDCK